MSPGIADQTETGGGGFTIEIHVAEDGSMTGDIESDDAEAQEPNDGSEPRDENSSTPLTDVAAACKFVEDAVANKGQVADAVAQNPDEMSDQDVWNQGAQQRAQAGQ